MLFSTIPSFFITIFCIGEGDLQGSCIYVYIYNGPSFRRNLKDKMCDNSIRAYLLQNNRDLFDLLPEILYRLKV